MAHYLGLMSGTSLDGVDLVWVEVDKDAGVTPPLPVRVKRFKAVPFSEPMRALLLKAIGEPAVTAPELIGLHHRLGEVFADMVADFIRELPIDGESIAALGMHGVTWWHQPDGVVVADGMGRGTMQLGDANVIAQRTGLRVVTDFRHADMALGGQGAPLAPFIDHMCFRSQERGRILLNLGGIANLTFLPAGSELITAHDSGPANIILDALMRRHPRNPGEYDPQGENAAAGRLAPQLLLDCLADPYFAKPAPKSTGRELFGAAYLQRFLDCEDSWDYNDLLTTAAHLTARTVVDAVRSWQAEGLTSADLHELYVSGGGVHNDFLMGLLRRLLPEMRVQPLTSLGFDVDAKEAALMALLAWARLNGVTGNFPGVTGASRPAVLGVMV